MKITGIILTLGETIPNPFEQYANSKPEITLTAEIEPGEDFDMARGRLKNEIVRFMAEVRQEVKSGFSARAAAPAPRVQTDPRIPSGNTYNPNPPGTPQPPAYQPPQVQQQAPQQPQAGHAPHTPVYAAPAVAPATQTPSGYSYNPTSTPPPGYNMAPQTGGYVAPVVHQAAPQQSWNQTPPAYVMEDAPMVDMAPGEVVG